MAERVATIVIESRLLVREALVSLMTTHSYHVVCCFASTADIDNSLLIADPPQLVILGVRPAGDAVTDACSIRKLWPETNIIFLFDCTSLADLQKLVVSEIDGCIPLSVSADTLIGTLRQIIDAGIRILVQRNATCSSMPCKRGRQEGNGSDLATNKPASSAASEATSSSAVALPAFRPLISAVVSRDVGSGVVDGASSGRAFRSLSEREQQILKGLVMGLSNKMMARRFNVTEATIKVHMKSILKKTRAHNRTQAAIWAAENRYCGHDLKNSQAVPRSMARTIGGLKSASAVADDSRYDPRRRARICRSLRKR
jgi:two-component system nitrate/nitrite response regulator NarL